MINQQSRRVRTVGSPLPALGRKSTPSLPSRRSGSNPPFQVGQMHMKEGWGAFLRLGILAHTKLQCDRKGQRLVDLRSLFPVVVVRSGPPPGKDRRINRSQGYRHGRDNRASPRVCYCSL